MEEAIKGEKKEKVNIADVICAENSRANNDTCQNEDHCFGNECKV